MAHKVNADHQPPLNLRGPLKEVFAISSQGAANWNKEERVDWNEDGKEPVPTHGDEIILNRNNHKERPKQRSVIGGPGGREGDELTEAEEGREAEKNHRPNAAREQGDREDGHHDPPGTHPGVKVCNHRAKLAGRPTALEAGD